MATASAAAASAPASAPAATPAADQRRTEAVLNSIVNPLRLRRWHLGFQPGYHPSFRGFDEYFGLPFSNDVGCLEVTAWNWAPWPSNSEQPEALCNLTAPPPGSSCAGVTEVTSAMRREAIRLFGDDREPFAAAAPHACLHEGGGGRHPVDGTIATPLYESLQPNCSAHAPCEMTPGGPNCWCAATPMSTAPLTDTRLVLSVEAYLECSIHRGTHSNALLSGPW